MKYDIDNQSRQSKAFQTRDAGLQVVKAGKSTTLDLRDEPTAMQIAAHDRAGVKVSAHVEAKADPKPKPEPERLKARDKAAD